MVKRDRSVSRSRSRTRAKNKHIVTVYPKKEGEDSESVKQKLQENINPVDLKVGISNLRKIQKGGVLVETEREEDVETLIKEIESNKKLKGVLECQRPKKRSPEIIVFSVDEKVEEEELLEAFRKQFDSDLEISVRTKFKSREGWNWVLQVPGEAFSNIVKDKKVFVGWRRYNIREHLRPVQCFKCGQFGHISKFCRNNELCKSCGAEAHKTDEVCPGKTCLNCTKYNLKFKTTFGVEHNCLDRACPIREKEVERLISRTDYG